MTDETAKIDVIDDDVRPTVWVLVRHADDGHQQMYWIGESLSIAREVVASLDDKQLLDYWWKIRQHYVGEEVR